MSVSELSTIRPVHESDQDIAKRVPGEPELFAVLVERYEQSLLRYLYRMGLSSIDDRVDVLQNSYIKAYKNILSFDTSLSFSAWMYRIVHNEAVSFLRTKKIHPLSNIVDDPDLFLSHIYDEDTDIAADTDKKLDALHVSQALLRIDEKYRTVLILRFFEEKDYQEIADILQIPPGSVATLIHRAKKQLSKELKHIQP